MAAQGADANEINAVPNTSSPYQIRRPRGGGDPSLSALSKRTQNLGPRLRGDDVFLAYASLPWQALNFLPLPQGQGSLRPTFMPM
jgi:hypothetical protein